MSDVRVSLEPITAVGDPPTGHANRDRGENGPPKRQCQVRDETNHRKRHPKDFALHTIILAANTRSIMTMPSIGRLCRSSSTRLKVNCVALDTSHSFGQ